MLTLPRAGTSLTYGPRYARKGRESGEKKLVYFYPSQIERLDSRETVTALVWLMTSSCLGGRPASVDKLFWVQLH